MRSKAICLVIHHYHFFLFSFARRQSHPFRSHGPIHHPTHTLNPGSTQYFSFRFRTFTFNLFCSFFHHIFLFAYAHNIVLTHTSWIHILVESYSVLESVVCLGHDFFLSILIFFYIILSMSHKIPKYIYRFTFFLGICV